MLKVEGLRVSIKGFPILRGVTLEIPAGGLVGLVGRNGAGKTSTLKGILGVFLHISREEQRERLQARLDDPEKRWKFRKGDLSVRARWDEYQAAYERAISETSTDWAPWYVVPADRKWVRDVAVATILVDTVRALDPRFPPPDPELDGIVVE